MESKAVESLPGGASRVVAAEFEQRQADWEAKNLSSGAARSYPARRRYEEAPCSLRTPFQRDRDRIVHSKSFRRLKHKTQVFILPEGDHYRTRLTHTLEACGISRTVARALRLNEDLTEAIGLGHDLGHTPFGHIGERALDICLEKRFKKRFHHNQHSLRLVEQVEGNGRGLNLTEQVRDGILRHTGDELPATLEGNIVRIVDRVAYINHDIDDAIRAGVIEANDLPQNAIKILGETGSKRIDTLVHDLVEHSKKQGQIAQSEMVGEVMGSLREFMFDRVYLGEAAQAERDRVESLVETLFTHYCENPSELPELDAEENLEQSVVDYIAGMTDRFAIRAYKALTVPREFQF